MPFQVQKNRLFIKWQGSRNKLADKLKYIPLESKHLSHYQSPSVEVPVWPTIMNWNVTFWNMPKSTRCAPKANTNLKHSYSCTIKMTGLNQISKMKFCNTGSTCKHSGVGRSMMTSTLDFFPANNFWPLGWPQITTLKGKNQNIKC